MEVHPNILSAYFLLSVVGALSVAPSFYLVGLYLVRPSSSRTNLWLLTRFVLRNDCEVTCHNRTR